MDWLWVEIEYKGGAAQIQEIKGQKRFVNDQSVRKGICCLSDLGVNVTLSKNRKMLTL